MKGKNMANQLDEMNSTPMSEGREIHVIPKQIPVVATSFEKFIPTLVVIVGVILIALSVFMKDYIIAVPGVIIAVYPWWKMGKISAKFNALEQRIQAAASEIDNYMEQRVIILSNLAKLVEKSIDNDEKILTDIAKYRSGNFTDESRNEAQQVMNRTSRDINVALENYPELKSQETIQDAMQQNSYLQREITAARTLYNDAVNTWNREIFVFPLQKIVAAKEGRTTRIPFIASEEIRQKSKEVFF